VPRNQKDLKESGHREAKEQAGHTKVGWNSSVWTDRDGLGGRRIGSSTGWSAEPGEGRMPLFDDQQLFRFQQLQSQTAWMYDNHKGLGFTPPVARPLFLEKEEEVRRGVETESKKIEDRMREQESQRREREDYENLNLIQDNGSYMT